MTENAKSAERRDARARLRRVLIDEVDGKRTCVLVLGDGVNRQAARQPPDRGSDWQSVLMALWREVGGAPREFLPADQSCSTAWAAVAAQWAAHHRCSVRSAERSVRERMCALLAPIEAATQRRRLYTQLLDGRLANVISFSVDRRLVLQSGASRVVPRYARASFLQRHLEVTGTRGVTRVWFPYGDTSEIRSIDPGHSAFDARLLELETARASLMDEHNDHDYGYGPGLRPPIYIYPRRWHAPATWCELFLCAPLVFIGASLPADDWPLWWLLHQRARYFVPFQDWEIAETFYLTSRPHEAGHVANGAAGLEIVAFRSDEDMWRFVLAALDDPGVEFHPGWDRHFGPRPRNPASARKRRARDRARPKQVIGEPVT
jgi:hypothetical protein